MTSALTVLLVRHGEQVRAGDDGELTDRGREQARLTAVAITPTAHDTVVSSGLRRSIQTAQAFGAEPRRVADLDEFRFGPQWTWDDSDAREDQRLWLPHHRAGGETLGEFENRVCKAFESLLEPRETGRLIIVVHAGVLDVILRWAIGATARPWLAEAAVGHASITELGVRRDPELGRAPRFTELRRVGDVTHLPQELRTGM